ncbi:MULTISPECIES: hypothetical protein [unclassified Methylobacterium]|uniref:hypothetical protein n=1 Tax=unclassified Methylobacterium TaxID=2615210 RepID=UPI0011C1F935|nr:MULTISPECIES: hypothetical protein [unclassified Methylobacterium]QEE39821.1 hypothetical protein FVA80_13530 [Methylobacterium sp. WL1]TXN57335.1 hypothetical protein FV241_11780 [Methylobacterium sp. WL2]
MSRSDRVHVYWNRTTRVWSLRQSGLVIDRRTDLVLHGCRFHAGESARLRVIRTGDRDVHAWVVGVLSDGPRPPSAIRVGYRPTEAGFRRRDTNEIVTSAVVVGFEPDGSCWAVLDNKEPSHA